MTVEARDDQADLTALRTGATTAGILVGLSILAMTVELIRSETEGDLRTLTATGASTRIRRTLTSATAGFLALLGALLGTAVAYLGSVSRLSHRTLPDADPVPISACHHHRAATDRSRNRLAPRRERADDLLTTAYRIETTSGRGRRANQSDPRTCK